MYTIQCINIDAFNLSVQYSTVQYKYSRVVCRVEQLSIEQSTDAVLESNGGEGRGEWAREFNPCLLYVTYRVYRTCILHHDATQCVVMDV